VRDRGGRLAGGLVAALLAVAVVAVGIPLNVVTTYLPAGVTGHRPLWVGLLAGGGLVIVALTLLSRRPDDGSGPVVLAGQVPMVAGWVDRAELGEVVSALTAQDDRLTARDGIVAVTTGLTGAGGFGKTMLAARACRDPKVGRWFRGGVVWVTVGQDTGDEELAARISEVVRNLGGDGPGFTSLEQAGQALAAALRTLRGRPLLVADDVWTAGQLAPFAVAAQAGCLLVTTRRAYVLEGTAARRIVVDAVPPEVARRLLRRELPQMAYGVEQELLGLAGGWPMLLSLVNRRLAGELRRPGSVIDVAAADAADRLRRKGPAALDVADDRSRDLAVAAVIGYSLDALAEANRDRFYELGVFAEDAEIPLAVVALLWRAIAGLDEDEAVALCEQLDRLSLVSLAWSGQARMLILHDVIRRYAAARLGQGRLAAVHSDLVSAARTHAGPAMLGSGGRGDPVTEAASWWRLPETGQYRYLWQYLTYHLKAAGLEAELDQVCCDLRFMAVRLRQSGPAGVEADLARSTSPLARRLRRAIARNAHLLGPSTPDTALTTILTSRLGRMPEVADQLPALRSDLRAWTARPDWPLPDELPEALLRILVGHTELVRAVAIAPDGTWLATGSYDGTVRIWTPDGALRAALTAHPRGVHAIAIAPDGTWLATIGGPGDATVRTWAADGTPRATFTAHPSGVDELVIAPDGTWLATTGDRMARIWAPDGTPGATLTSHVGWVRGLAIAPGGTWLVTTGGWEDKTARIWTPDGTPVATLTGHTGSVDAVAIAPDGTWLATASFDGTVRIWAPDGTPRATFTAHPSGVDALVIAPDGTWLATGGRHDGTVRIWAPDGTPHGALAAYRSGVHAVAISPDGTWLATTGTGLDGTVRIWATDGTARTTLTGPPRSEDVMAIAPDGTWLASGGANDGRAQIWATDGTSRAADGTPRATITEHKFNTGTIAIAPDGTWLATADLIGRIWSADGTLRLTLSWAHAVAISPDGTWLVTGGSVGGAAQVWAADGTPRATFTHPRSDVHAVAIAPDGTWLVTAGGWTVRIWTPDGTPRAALPDHPGWVHAVAISPDGTWLATASSDGTARTWAADGTPRTILTGHTKSVNAVAISPDGTWLATASSDGTARTWAADGTPRITLTGHTSGVRAVAISPDGNWLATAGGSDGTARIWAAEGTGREAATMVRVDGTAGACAWFPTGFSICVAGSSGAYRLSLQAPPS
jgi:WD40 repeat protein